MLHNISHRISPFLCSMALLSMMMMMTSMVLCAAHLASTRPKARTESLFNHHMKSNLLSHLSCHAYSLFFLYCVCDLQATKSEILSDVATFTSGTTSRHTHTCTHTHTHKHTHRHRHSHTRMHTLTHTYTYAYTQTHIHTQTPTSYSMPGLS